jgi:hypothetical protein
MRLVAVKVAAQQLVEAAQMAGGLRVVTVATHQLLLLLQTVLYLHLQPLPHAC